MVDSNTIFQNCWYIGNQFNGILYGIQLSLYYTTITHIKNERKRDGHNRFNNRLLYLSTLFLVTATIHVAVQAVFGEEMWIVNVNYPGGTAQYFSDFAAVWYETMDTASGVLMNMGTDGYQIYRLWVVWNHDIRIIVFPCLVYCVSIVLGVVTVVVSGEASANFFAGLASEMALAYVSCSIGINIMCSALVCARILWASRQVKKTLGPEATHSYINAASVVVECMLPLAVTGLAYVITNGIGHPTSILFFSFYEMSALVIVRVLTGRAYTPPPTQGPRTTLRFRSMFTNPGSTTNAEGATTASPTVTGTDPVDTVRLNDSDLTVSKEPGFISAV